MAKLEIKAIKPDIFNALYFIFFTLLPFVYSDKIIDPVLIPRQIYLSCFVFLVGSIISYKVFTKKLIAEVSFIKLLLPLLILGFLLSNIISAFQSIAITEGIYVISKLTIEILFFIITTYLIIQKELDLSVLIKSIVVFSIISVVIAIFQMVSVYFSERKFLYGILLVNSTYANKNLLSSILFLTLPFIITATILSKQWKIVSLILFPIIVILLLIIKTKAVIIALILSFLFSYFFFIRKSKANFKVFYIILFATLTIAGLFIFQNKNYFSSLINKNSTAERLVIWGNSVQMIKENPILGVGSGNWQIHFPKFGLDKFDFDSIKNGMTTYQRPHNDFLWVFSETGIPGILTYIFIFSTALFYLIKLIKSSKKMEDHRLYLALFAGIIGYIFISFVDFPLERVEHQILLYLIFSIIVAHFYSIFHISTKSKKIMLRLPLLIFLFFIPVIFSFVVCVKRYSGEYHTQKMYSFHHQNNWTQMIREADKASNFYYSMDPTSAPIEWYKGVALFALGNINDAKISFEKAYSIHPYNIHVLNNLASCYETLKDHKGAEDFYLQTLSISSEFEEARLNLSAVYFNNGQYEKAFETIDKCSVKSKDPKYQLFLPVILNSLIEVKLSKQTDITSMKTKLGIRKTNKRIMKFYFDSKEKGVKFDKYLLEKAR